MTVGSCRPVSSRSCEILRAISISGFSTSCKRKYVYVTNDFSAGVGGHTSEMISVDNGHCFGYQKLEAPTDTPTCNLCNTKRCSKEYMRCPLQRVEILKCEILSVTGRGWMGDGEIIYKCWSSYTSDKKNYPALCDNRSLLTMPHLVCLYHRTVFL